MSQNLADRFRRWFEYEKDSHAKVIASLHSVPAERRGEELFTKAVTLMAHIVEARRIWLSRLGIAPVTNPDFFPEGLSLEELESRVEAAHALWTGYLKRVDDSELARVFNYRSYEGDPYRNSVEEVLTQLYGHSLYHRGQIASLVRAAGGEPAATDYIFWTRQAIPAAAARLVTR
jgi:uncharacterized damage-inducible protein DinB